MGKFTATGSRMVAAGGGAWGVSESVFSGPLGLVWGDGKFWGGCW